jgi:hypothetical protein
MKKCIVKGCGGKHVGKEYCGKHRAQMYRRGKILSRTRSTPNQIIDKGNYLELVVYNRLSEIIAYSKFDKKFLLLVKKHKWSLSSGYVCTRINKRLSFLHRMITNCPKNLYTDHKSGDILDNRSSNLRICDKQQNAWNQRKSKRGSSLFKGVSWNKLLNSWRADIKISKEQSKFLGSFKSQRKAAVAYNQAALKYYGEFARLNIIN